MFTHLRLALMVASSIIVMVVPSAAQLTSGPIDTSPPSGFEENKGQISDQFGRARPDVRFSFVQKGFRMRLLRNGVAYELTQSSRVVDGDVHRPFGVDEDVHRPFKTPVEVQRVDVGFAGAAAMPRIETGEVLDGYANYYYAHLPESGATFVRSYASVIYRDLYEGVDMVVHTRASLDGSTWPVSTDFVVRAGADPAQIRIRYEGARDVRVTAAGELEITTDLGTIREQAPICRAQLPTGGYVNVGGRYRLEQGEVSFALDAYPTDAILTIDPGLVWATYYGGTGDDVFNDVGSDLSGAIYAAGTTASTASIATTGAHKTTIGGTSDAMLVKFRPTNGGRMWATYAGGTNAEWGNAVAVSPTGTVFLAGSTASASGLATSGAYKTAHGGFHDGFVMRFDSAGVRTFSTYYGGTSDDDVYDIALAGTTHVVIVGQTESTAGIASTSAHQTAYGGSRDAFFVRLSWDGATRTWGTYYGGSSEDKANCVTVDGNGLIIVGGMTSSSSGIATTGAHDEILSTFGSDGFLARFSATGSRSWGTYYGGRYHESISDVAVDASNNIYFGGYSSSPDDVATSGAYLSSNTSGHLLGMLGCLTTTGTRQWATYIGSDVTMVSGIAINGSTLYLCGTTSGSSHIAANSPFQSAIEGGDEGFVGAFTTSGTGSWGTYYGGTARDMLRRMTVVAGGSNAGDIIACGVTESDGIARGAAFQSTRGGAQDAFLLSMRRVTIGVASLGTTVLCKNAALAVPYTITGTFGSSNVFRAQLSNKAGSFESGTSQIGLRMSPSAGTINGTVPSAPPSGIGYRIRVYSSNPIVYSSSIPATFTLHPSDTGWHSWRGTVNSAWNEPGNWANPCSLPGADDTVAIHISSHAPVTPSASTTLKRIELSHPLGISLGGNLTLTGSLELNFGTVALGAYDLTLAPGATITGGDDSALVKTNGLGALRSQGVMQGGVQVVRLPIGTGLADPNFVTIHNRGTVDEFRARVAGTVTLNGQSGGTAVLNHIVSRMWYISEATPGGSSMDVTLGWMAWHEHQPFDRTTCFGARNVGGVWQPITPVGAATGTFPIFSRVFTGQSEGGTLAIGDLLSPIPVELVLFSARAEGADVVLAWETADERSNAGFEVQRARVDDDAWTVVSFVAARAAEGSGATYETVDRSVAAGTWRYRLRQVDLDGHAEYSQAVTVVVGDAAAVLLVAVHPNPARDAAQVVVRDARVVVVRDVLGREVWRAEVADGGVQTLVVPTQFMPAGVYVVETDLARTLLRIVR